ncbi:DUF2922 domain-containing protein [Pseudoneobacillus sp. C159]
MARTLELQFGTLTGGSTRITIESPIEPVEPAKVKAAMNSIIAADIFTSPSGNLVSIKGARLVERNVTDYEIL